MQIKKIFVRNFRKFLQPVTIAGLAPGVTVIAGSNEEGKSTIVQALRSAFHLKYSTQATAHIQPYNSSAMPEVAIDFDLSGTTYQLRKVFGKKGTAELRSAGSVFMGSEAEEKLHELCNTYAERKETSIWNVLWVEQGTTFGEIKLGDTGKRTLQSALERELGSIVGGDDGQQLLKSVGDLYLKWYTATGRDAKHSEHKQAEEQLGEIDALLTAAAAQFEELQGMLSQLETTRSALRAHEEGRTVENLQEQLEGLLKKKSEVTTHLTAFEQAQQVERTEQAQQAAAATWWKQRSQLVHEADSSAERLKSIELRITEAADQHKLTSEQLHKLQQERAGLEAAYEEALSQCESAERLEQVQRLQAQIKEVEDAIERAQSAQKHCDEIASQGEAIKVDRASVESIRTSERHVMQLDAQLEAVATRLQFLPAGKSAHATVDGAATESGQELLVTNRTVVSLPGWGGLVVTPGGGDLDKLKGNAARARVAFGNALAAAGVQSLEEAEQLDRKKAELRLEWQSWHREIQTYAPAGVPALEDQLAVMKGKFGESDEQLPVASLAEAAERLQQLRAQRDAAKQNLSQSRLRADQCEAAFRESDRQLQSLSVQQKTLQDELVRLNERLTADRAQAADDVLFQSVQEAELRIKAASKKRAELEELLKALNASAVDSDIEECQRKQNELQAELQRLKDSQSRLEGALQTLGKTGITEEVEKLRGKKEQAEVQLARANHKARAIKLLNDTLLEAERNSKQQLAEPLMRRLTPYMTELFAGSTFAFDEDNFGVVQLERQAAEPFQCLSLGTREQISVLTRLAFAETLAETGSPAVVILDDALVYSDEARFARMQEVLKRAGEKFQIIIMTCRESDYTGMGVPIVRLADCVGRADHSVILSAQIIGQQIQEQPDIGHNPHSLGRTAV